MKINPDDIYDHFVNPPSTSSKWPVQAWLNQETLAILHELRDQSMVDDRVIYCHHCGKLTDSRVVRGCGVTFWECANCRSITDEDFDDPHAHEGYLALDSEQSDCSECRYFHQWPHLEGTNTGVCRFHAVTQEGFPGTTRDNWCGEWVPK